jgi:hypothetical protein
MYTKWNQKIILDGIQIAHNVTNTGCEQENAQVSSMTGYNFDVATFLYKIA